MTTAVATYPSRDNDSVVLITMSAIAAMLLLAKLKSNIQSKSTTTMTNNYPNPIPLTYQISTNFNMSEMYKSATAKARGIDNTPPQNIRVNICNLVNEVLQPIRTATGHALKISSCYRCPALNTAVGGSATSQHKQGEAADFDAVGMTNGQMFKYIYGMIQAGKIKVGQLIWEYGTSTNPSWIHISLPSATKTNQVLKAYKSGGKTVYVNFKPV